MVIDLQGPQGNAFALMGVAKSIGTQLGYAKADIDSIITQMTAGDYKNLVQVFDSHFSAVVELENMPE
jgi:hypothetical protein